MQKNKSRISIESENIGAHKGIWENAKGGTLSLCKKVYEMLEDEESKVFI